MIPLSDNMMIQSGKLSLYLYSQSSQIILMDKTNQQYDHSDESVVAKMSELKENLQARMQEIESQLSWSIANAQEAMKESIEQLETEMEEAIDEIDSEIKQCEELLK